MISPKGSIFPKAVLAAGLLTAVVLTGAAPASATTFCVPGFHAGCTHNGTRVAVASLEVAMGRDGSDGVPDRVLVGPVTYTDTGSLKPGGTDPLTVVGSGAGRTRITTSSTDNIFAVNLYGRSTSMRDLTIVVPASFPDAGGNGAALQTEGGTFDRVNFESRNPGSDAVSSALGNNTFRDCRVYGTAGGFFHNAFRSGAGAGPGTLRIVRTIVRGARFAVSASTDLVPVLLRQSRLLNSSIISVQVISGGRVDIENTLIAGDGPAVSMATSNGSSEVDASASIRSSTIVSTGESTGRPFQIFISDGLGSRSASLNIADSIISGFDKTWYIDAPAGPGIGIASIAFTDSNFLPLGVLLGSAAVDVSDPGNINLNPRFVGSGNYRLRANSPSVDAGAHAAGGPTVDLDGRRRPVDGDGNGTAVRDQGAFERPDLTAPKVTLLKARKLRKGALRLSLRLSEPARLTYTLKPVPKRARGKRRRTVVIKRAGRRGDNALVLAGRRLSRGRYVVRVIAIDASGNRSVALIRTP